MYPAYPAIDDAGGVMLTRVRVIVSGRVQGVYYRAYAVDEARELGLTGWVKNIPGGRVEAVFEGEEEAVRRMVDWCWKGSPSSRVESVEVFREEATGEYSSFTVAYGGRGGI
ncbi:MAG: acylphosphatase [Actinomycetota bacterium]|nr:acylphosphatase [Actinomycetota bacterium]MDD5665820.1 acylphosphatase [Actinomycetota bacterium]